MRRASQFGLLGLCALGSCATADLRTAEILEVRDRPAAERKGRELLERAIDAAGGRKQWQSFSSVAMGFQDEWQGFLGWLFRPWPSNPTRLYMRYELHGGAVDAAFLEGSQRETHWGVDRNGFWSQTQPKDRDYHSRESARFILRAYQYFFELPFEIANADIVLYAGERIRDERLFDLVFATWQSAQPHLADDQYLLWIARDTGRLEMVQYTIRDKYRFATGVNRFSEFREVQGLVLPHRYWIAEDPDDRSYIHAVRLRDVVFER